MRVIIENRVEKCKKCERFLHLKKRCNQIHKKFYIADRMLSVDQKCITYIVMIQCFRVFFMIKQNKSIINKMNLQLHKIMFDKYADNHKCSEKGISLFYIQCTVQPRLSVKHGTRGVTDKQKDGQTKYHEISEEKKFKRMKFSVHIRSEKPVT